MTPEQALALREPFAAPQIGKLPKPYKKDSPKGICKDCGGYHGLPAAHLDYVGHAAVTDRLLKVDPEWTWEPVAHGPDGLPLLDANGGLWIRMTIAGVSRLGYGDQTNGKGMKEIIGDALRNAAMRFGVALDLWSKEDLQAEADDDADATIDDAQLSTLRDLLAAAEKEEIKFCAWLKVETLESLQADRYQEALSALNQALKQKQAR